MVAALLPIFPLSALGDDRGAVCRLAGARGPAGPLRRLMKRYCGRDFTDAEIETIRQQIAQSPTLTRADLSRLTCRQLGWFKPDGGLKGDELSCRDAAHARRWRDAAPRAPRDELKDPVRRRRARPPTRNQNCDNQSTSCPRCSFSPSCRVRTPAWGMPTSSVITIWALYPAARGTNSHLRHHPGTAGGALGLRGRRLGYGTP